MCTSNNFPSALIPYGLKLQAPMAGFAAPYPAGMSPAAGLELQRSQAAQLYDYGARIRLGLHYAAAAAGHPGFNPYQPGPHDPFALMYAKHCDPRMRFLHEEPKPSHSYIGLIAMGILTNKDQKMVLSDIYQYILDNYPYFRTRGPGWRNSIRHNLSLNDCFIKSGRSANGKGHYWAIHPANVEDFKKGDFRRRRAQRKVRKAMGLAVPDDEDSPSPPPQSDQPGPPVHWAARVLGEDGDEHTKDDSARDESFGDNIASSPELKSPSSDGKRPREESSGEEPIVHRISPYGIHPGAHRDATAAPPSKKRLFDVDSLLAPDTDRTKEAAHADNMNLRAHAALPYFGRSFPGGLPHPGLLPPPHMLPRELIQRNLQLHKALLGAHKTPLVVEPETPDLSKPLEIDTTRDTESEKIDITGTGSPDQHHEDEISNDDLKSARSPFGSQADQDNTDREGKTSPESVLPKMPLTSTSWIPMPLLHGAWKEHHPSAFRSTLPPGHRAPWAPGAHSVIQMPAGPTALRLPTSGSR